MRNCRGFISVKRQLIKSARCKARGEMERIANMTTGQILIIVTIILYMAGMIAIGVAFNRKGATETSHGFYLGYPSDARE